MDWEKIEPIDWANLSKYQRSKKLKSIKSKRKNQEKLNHEEKAIWNSYCEWREDKPGKKETKYEIAEAETEESSQETAGNAAPPDDNQKEQETAMATAIAEALRACHRRNVDIFGFPPFLEILIQEGPILQFIKKHKLITQVDCDKYMIAVVAGTVGPQIYHKLFLNKADDEIIVEEEVQ